VAAPTIECIENGAGCQVRIAKAIADRFALRVSEMFEHDNGDSLRCPTVAELRDAMRTERSTLHPSGELADGPAGPVASRP
jgi:hypothetical protein